MPPFVLKTIRFSVPAGMLYFLLAGICWFSNWCHLTIPNDYDQLTKSISALILGFVYNVSYLREVANRKYYDAVNRNITTRLTAPFASDPNVPKGLSWRQIRPVFYNFVDNDASLKHQATLAYWNGALWTSAADLRAISGIGCVSTAVCLIIGRMIGDDTFDYIHAAYFFMVVASLFFLSFLFSELSTRRHITIGTRQCLYIIQEHRNRLRAQLINAALQ
jgi:hypothetical protein